jgi:hypothetical protein
MTGGRINTYNRCKLAVNSKTGVRGGHERQNQVYTKVGRNELQQCTDESTVYVKALQLGHTNINWLPFKT